MRALAGGFVVVVAIVLTGCTSEPAGPEPVEPTHPATSRTTPTISTTTTTAAPTVEPTTVLTARRVMDAISAEGLPAQNSRDSTAQLCKDWGCLQLITANEFSVYQFADAAQASRVAGVFPSGYLNGLIFLRFTRDGSHPTDPAMIPRYRAVLDGLRSR